MTKAAHLVCFRIGQENFGVDIFSVREIVKAQAITPVPGTAEHVLGIINLRIHQECGLYFADNRRAFLSSRIGRRLLARSIGSFFRYYSYLKQGGTEEEEELLQLLDVLTINEASFFRNLPQFEILEQRVLPELLERKAEASERSLRIWSAGCSTGEEPYSIAISVLEALPTRPEWQVKIYASDLSLSVLEKAANGRYAKARLQDLTPARLRRFFEPDDGGHRVVEALKRLVIFDFHNLKHENGLGDLDIVFCRNVLIYFDPQEQKKVINKLARALRPGGYLFLGHSESVQGMGPELEFVHHQRGTAYRKREIA